MRIHIILLLTISLSTCSSINQDKVAPGYFQAFNAIKSALVGYENTNITRDIVDRIPYASSLISMGKGPYGLMILESKQNKKETWVTADGIYLVIEEGRIIKTAGLSNNLNEVIRSSNSNFYELTNYKNKDNFKFYYSFRDPDLYRLPVDVSFRVYGHEEVDILNKSRKLFKVEEKIENKQIGWKRTNTYWLDDNLFVWKSLQFISPKLPPVKIEVTKKPS